MPSIWKGRWHRGSRHRRWHSLGTPAQDLRGVRGVRGGGIRGSWARTVRRQACRRGPSTQDRGAIHGWARFLLCSIGECSGSQACTPGGNMSKIVAAIFADRAKAYEGYLALKYLAAKGVEVHASAIISKGSDSKLSVLEDSYDGFRVTAVAALIGGLAGLRGGPLGALMGAVGGALIGGSAELTVR